jgi:hypothetical protein
MQQRKTFFPTSLCGVLVFGSVSCPLLLLLLHVCHTESLSHNLSHTIVVTHNLSHTTFHTHKLTHNLSHTTV